MRTRQLRHGDIKWENVGLEDGRVVLRDFGTLRTVRDATLHPALLGARVAYALPILLALSPFPFLRIRTFAELLDRIERAPRLQRRRIALAAGIWKTKIVMRWAALAVVTILLAYWIIMTGLYLHQRNTARAKWGTTIDAAVKSRTGLGPVNLNSPTNAVLKIQSRQD